MRLTTLAGPILLASAACTSPSPGATAPPLLPQTGRYEIRDQEWLKQTRLLPTHFNGVEIEERSAHFGMNWGGANAFQSGKCTVDQEFVIDCGTPTFFNGDAPRRFLYTSHLSGVLVDSLTLELEHWVSAVCEGDGCWENDGYEGYERATLVWSSTWE